ncbi:ABC transporter permease subunit [Alteromonas sp. ASW11-36]|uniref:ABC transporter permease subunit n=1 Tax=Alteromonas arenosi TaxID=3055817 RepID=A0ABT7SUY2_9ALTE|nr:ABC transporter permease subunit [Alteromonas sp. ASW11-36]MDM7860004.1 ABC transporter permease subunit [Alteromonas sp. ASW11-36]
MWLVMQKELKELLRDRKTLFFMIALPLLLFPAIFGVAMYFGGQAVEKARSEVLTFAILNAERAPQLSQSLAEQELLNRVEIEAGTDISEWVKQGGADFVIEVPVNYGNNPLESGQIELKVYFNDAGLNMVERRIREVTDSIAENNQAQVFELLGVDADKRSGVLNPIVIEKINVADQREDLGEKAGGFVPYIVFILCLQGAMLPATDLGAGEKERGTLETLLISPIERHNIVMGKFFAIAISGVVSALITVVSMAVWGTILSHGMAAKVVVDFMAAISLFDFLLMFLMLVPVVAIFASALLSLSIYARSFKEAQGYMTPLVFVVIIPVVLAMLPGVDLEGGWAWVPLTNVALAIKELIKGTMDYFALLPIFGSTAIIAGGLIYFSIFWFNREKVLFR